MRTSRSAIVRSARTSPGEETKTRMVFIMLRNGEGPLDPVPEAALIHQSAKPSAPQWAILANLRRSPQEDLECRMMSSCPCGLAAIASPRVADLISLGEPANGSI